jgi:hypothetical protein
MKYILFILFNISATLLYGQTQYKILAQHADQSDATLDETIEFITTRVGAWCEVSLIDGRNVTCKSTVQFDKKNCLLKLKTFGYQGEEGRYYESFNETIDFSGISEDAIRYLHDDRKAWQCYMIRVNEWPMYLYDESNAQRLTKALKHLVHLCKGKSKF